MQALACWSAGSGRGVPGPAPEAPGESEAAFELIYGEFLLREQLGESPAPEEFYWRFPRFAARLARQLELHRRLNSDGSVRDDRCWPGERSELPAETMAPAPIRSVAPGYEILGELGRGGMGTVYKAWQVSLKRVVALKVIRADAYADTEAAARFHAEAEAAARFQHPNIVQVFEVGENDGLGYLVLEYVAGGGLDRKLAGPLQDPHDSARLIETLARAIHYAHQHGIVHRDLKPANVLLTEDGVPKITDFGLAKLLERDEGLTQVGELLGTPSYMAPEQIRGTSRPDHAGDRRLRPGSDPVRDADGPPAVQGDDAALDDGASFEPGAAHAQQDPASHAPRPGDHLSQVPAEGPAPPVRHGLGTGRRPAAVPRQPADPGPADAGLGACLEMGPAPPCRGGGTRLRHLVAAVLLLVGRLALQRPASRGMRKAQAAEQRRRFIRAIRPSRSETRLWKPSRKLVYDVQEKLGQTPATRSLRQDLLEYGDRGSRRDCPAARRGRPPT